MIKRVFPWLLLLVGLGASFALAARPAGHGRKKGASPAKPASRSSPVAGRITYIGDDANVYVCDGSCDRPACITCPPKAEQALAGGFMRVALTRTAARSAVQYDWPTFSPDGSQVAYSSLKHAGGSSIYGINAYDLG